jgi:zinc protease
MLNRTLAPESKPLTNIDIPQMQSIALNNHHKLHFFEAKFTQVLKLELFWQAGSIFETTPNLANFTAKMLTEGTEKYSAQHIISQIDQYGAFIETNGGFERVSITIYTLSKYFEKVLAWVKEIILNSNFPENEWLNLQQISKNLFMVKNTLLENILPKKIWILLPKNI